MKLYNANLSPNALRVRAVLFELGLEAEIIDVDLRTGENKADAFLALNPNAKVPVLDDDGFVLWESRAINGYLASKRPERGLYPAEPKARAVVDQWSYWQAIHLGPAMQRVAFERYMKGRFGRGGPDEAVVKTEMANVTQFLGVLDGALAGKEWVAGALSIADFAIATTFQYRAQADISLAATPQVERWIAQLEARPSWQKAIAPIKAAMG
ncbi:MAG: glutathione S-transferase family protein [Hyphomonadaceae bacterium]